MIIIKQLPVHAPILYVICMCILDGRRLAKSAERYVAEINQFTSFKDFFLFNHYPNNHQQ